MANIFSAVSWAVNDVKQSLEEINQRENLDVQMTEDECMEFLSEIEDELLDAMIIRGWSVLDSRLEEKLGIRKAEAVDVKA